MRHMNATRTAAAIIGVIAGAAGMEHGLFEILQGDVPTGGMVIDAIGPAQRFWEYGGEPAFTVMPTFLSAGIFSVCIALLVILCSAAFLGRRSGVIVMTILTITLFLTGGGFAPPTFALLAIAFAAAGGRFPQWLRAHVPAVPASCLARFRLPLLIVFSAFASALVFLAVFGYPLRWILSAEDVLAFMNVSGYATFFGLGPLTLITSLAYDIRGGAGGPEGGAKP